MAVHFDWSFKDAVGRHWFTVGGGPTRWLMEFRSAGQDFAWQSVDQDPLVLRQENGVYFLAVYDYSDQIKFSRDILFLRSNEKGEFLEMSAKEFPPHLAVQNLFLNSETLRLLREHDYRNPHFARTFTAQMLWKIHDPVAYNFHDSPTTETMKTIMETYFKDTDFPSP
jgi:hypothetical protein